MCVLSREYHHCTTVASFTCIFDVPVSGSCDNTPTITTKHECAIITTRGTHTDQVSHIMRDSHAFASSLTLARMGSKSLMHSNLPSKLTPKAYVCSAQTPQKASIFC